MEPILNKKDLYDLIGCIDGLSNHIRYNGYNNISDNFKNGIKDLLNKVFGYNVSNGNKQAKCKSVTITPNTDRMFFGCFIKLDMPWNNIFHGHDISDVELSALDYSIDIDSKLFSMELDLVPGQITALIIHDVYRMTSFDTITDSIAAMDAVLVGMRESFSTRVLNDKRLKDLLNYSTLDYLYRSRSIFAKKENEVIRIPELLSSYELDSVLVDALDPLFKNKDKMSEDINHPTLTLNWAINVILKYESGYVDVIGILRALRDTCPSTLQQNYLNSIILRFIDMSYKEEGFHMNSQSVSETSLFNGIRKNGLKSLENDLFEYEMRVKNVDDENSAILLMRQINNRIGIISDYLEEENLSDAERRRWQAIYDRYDKLRIKMTNKPIYSRKMYGLYTDYNALMQPGAANTLTMNTYY